MIFELYNRKFILQYFVHTCLHKPQTKSEDTRFKRTVGSTYCLCAFTRSIFLCDSSRVLVPLKIQSHLIFSTSLVTDSRTYPCRSVGCNKVTKKFRGKRRQWFTITQTPVQRSLRRSTLNVYHVNLPRKLRQNWFGEQNLYSFTSGS